MRLQLSGRAEPSRGAHRHIRTSDMSRHGQIAGHGQGQYDAGAVIRNMQDAGRRVETRMKDSLVLDRQSGQSQGVALQRVIGHIMQGKEQRQRNMEQPKTRDVWKQVARSMKNSGASDGRHRTHRTA